MENPQIRRFLYSKAALQHVPLGGTFEITPRCNLNCKMCYIRLSKEEQERQGRERSAQEWIALGEVCRNSGMLFLLLTGGEPFLRPDFREIYEGLYQLGLMITINTNGTLLTKEMVEWLKDRPPTKVNITLYGGSEDTYEKLCGFRDGYIRATSAILMLKEAGIHVSVSTSYTGENTEEMDQIFAFIKEHKLPTRMTSYMFPPARKQEYDEGIKAHRMTPEDAGYAMWKSAHHRFEENWQEHREMVLKGIPLEDEECVRDEKMQCMAGRSVFWVTWNWQIRGCGMMSTPTMEVCVENFTAVWKILGEQIDEIRMPKECSVCKYRSACTVCGAVVQAEGHGNMEKVPEYMCRMTREYIRLVQKAT